MISLKRIVRKGVWKIEAFSYEEIIRIRDGNDKYAQSFRELKKVNWINPRYIILD